MLNCLQPGEGLAEGLPLGNVLPGLLEHPLTHGSRDDCNGQALLRQLSHQHVEAAVSHAQQVALGHPDVLEEELSRVLRLEAKLLEVPPLLEALHAILHHNEGGAMSLGLRIRIGDGHDDVGVSHDAVGDEGLAAVEDEVVAVQLGVGPDSLKV